MTAVKASAVFSLLCGLFAASEAGATIVISIEVNGNRAACSAGPNEFLDLFPTGASQGSASFANPASNQSADCQVAINPAAGHVGIAFSGQNVAAGSLGYVGYLITLDAGDQLQVGWSVSGSVSGNASVVASIADTVTMPVGQGVACTALGCNGPLRGGFVLGPGVHRLHLELRGDTDGLTPSSANFLNSLDATFIAPAGSSVLDSLGLIQLPEPAPAAMLLLACAGLAALGSRARRL